MERKDEAMEKLKEPVTVNTPSTQNDGAAPQLEKRTVYVEGKGNTIIDVVTGNPYYDYLIHEVMVVCNCPWLFILKCFAFKLYHIRR